MSETERAELDRLRTQAKDGRPVMAITSRQLTTLITILTGVASTILGGGYVTMTSQVETVVDSQVDATVADKVEEDVAAKDASNRKVVKEELAAVMITVNARVDKDREGFSKQIDALDKRMEAQEKTTDTQSATLIKLDDKLGNIGLQQKADMKEILGAIREEKAP